MPVHGTAKLYLTVTTHTTKGKEVKRLYDVRWLAPSREVCHPAWRLTKTDGEFFDIALTVHGPVCSCPDFVMRRDGRELGCKHILSARAVGLLRADIQSEVAR